ncbi:metallophosphoesterase [Blastococcus litoris]|uniref:metallophosphoesterase n=1 Tax=Blastococcus litoris TaxID=2171622 RepID=UPI000E304722|nr:metallophosphoesterase [Blastococcus litoris]
MRRLLPRIGLALGTLLVLLLAYGVLIEPRVILDEEHAEVALPQLGDELAGTEVAVLSDLQLGMWFANHGMVERAVEATLEADPDVVLLGGDFVYSSDPTVQTQIDTLLELIGPLIDSGIPTYAVLGNHDYKVGAAEELTTALEDAGIPVLSNTAVPVPGPVDDPAEQLHVVGIGPDLPNRVDVDAALADVPDTAPRVVLMHNPTVFDQLPAGTAPLALAGHTHCGQVALPGTPDWAYLALTSEERIVADGWAPEGYGAEGNRMFVTCGIGFSVAPIRINAAPQVAFFTLQPEN